MISTARARVNWSPSLRNGSASVVVAVTIWTCSPEVYRAAFAADQSAAFVTPFEVFQGLSLEEQRVLVSDAYVHRMALARNLHYEAHVILTNHKYRDGEIGEELWAGLKFGHRHWSLDGVYRKDTDQFGPPTNNMPDTQVSSGFNFAEGIGRATVRGAGLAVPGGRIDVVEDPLVFEDRFGYWLDGRHSRLGDFLFRYLVDNIDKSTFKLLPAQKSVQLCVPWKEVQGHGFVGERVLDLDLEKGFLPVHVLSRWEARIPGVITGWRTEEMFVDDMQLVADVWMPTSLTEVIQASTSPDPEMANVMRTMVSAIEVGNVRPDDLVVKFSEGTHVVDAINGIAYTADSEGNPKPDTIEILMGTTAITAAIPAESGEGEQASPRSLVSVLRRSWLVHANLGLLLILLIVAGIMKWRKSMAVRRPNDN